MENSVPGTTTQTIFQKASGAGARGIEDLAKCGASGKHKGNVHRDLKRKIMKECTFTGEYWAYVPILNKATQEVEEVPMPVLLPHEVLANFIENDQTLLETWAATSGQGAVFGQVYGWCAKMEVDQSKMIPLGIHGDGVPFAAKMRDSLECISWNILTDPAGLRILFTCFPKSATAERHTWDCLLEIFSWSMRHLLMGVWPSKRHDRQPWQKTTTRKGQARGAKILDSMLGCCRGGVTGPSTSWCLIFLNGHLKLAVGDVEQGTHLGMTMTSGTLARMLDGGNSDIHRMTSLAFSGQRALNLALCLAALVSQWTW